MEKILVKYCMLKAINPSFVHSFLLKKNSMHFYFINAIFILVFYFTVFSISKEDLETIDHESESDAFLAFVKGNVYFDKYCQENVVKSAFLSDHTLSFDEQKEHLAQKFEAKLGTMYRMRSKWQNKWRCAKLKSIIHKKSSGEEKPDLPECKKISKYLDVLHEHFVRIYIEAILTPLIAAEKMPAKLAVPQFEINGKSATFFGILKNLNLLSKLYFDTKFKNEDAAYKMEELYPLVGIPNLLNETEMDAATTTPKESLAEAEKKDVFNPAYWKGYRKYFDKMLKKMWKSAKAKAMSERKEFLKNQQRRSIEQKDRNQTEQSEMAKKCAELNDKFGIIYKAPIICF